MILFILANWRWLLPSIGMAALGVWLGFAKIENADLHLVIANMKTTEAQELAKAAQVGADAEKRARDAENKAAEAARSIDEQHAEDLKAIDAGAAAFRVRIAQARASCHGMPVAAAPAGQPAGTAGGSQPGPGEPVNPSAVKLRDAALRLQADVKACWGWAATAGR